MKDRKNLWIVTELFYPDEISTAYIMTEIAKSMTKEYTVNVICGNPNVKDRISDEKLDDNIRIYRCGKSTTSGKNLFKRLWHMLVLTLGMVVLVCKKVKRDEKVLMVTNPLLLLLMMSVISKFKRMHLYLLVHDIFPENAYAAGLFKSKNSVFYKLIKKIFNTAYNSVDELIVLGRDMKEVVEQKVTSSMPVTIIENWADLQNIFPTDRNFSCLKPLEVQNKVIIQYAGNVGRVQGLKCFIECLNEAGNDCIHFSIWGDGSYRKDLEHFVAENRIQNVSFHGSYKRNQQCEILNACHLALISLSENMYGLGVPSKSYNIMAANKPILYIGDTKSEIALTLKEHNIGFVINNKKEDIVSFLKKLSFDYLNSLNMNARDVAESMYSESIIMDKFLKILK